MSASRKRQRAAEIKLVREMATQAFFDGKSRESCPYRYSDKYQWQEQWDREMEMFVERSKELEEQAESAGDLNIAIGEHAFKAGFKACAAWLEPAYADSEPTAKGIKVMEAAWSEYTPPDDLCAGGAAG